MKWTSANSVDKRSDVAECRVIIAIKMVTINTNQTLLTLK